jgi:hypothetical protein
VDREKTTLALAEAVRRAKVAVSIDFILTRGLSFGLVEPDEMKKPRLMLVVT